MRRIIQHLKDNSGSAYIESTVCLTALLIVSVIVFTVASSLVDKLWVDEKMSDIAKLIDSSGTIKSEAIYELEDAIVEKFGGTITYECEFVNDDETKGQIQLNDVVIIHFDCPDYKILNVFGAGISTDIHLQKTAVSGVYYKPVNEMID